MPLTQDQARNIKERIIAIIKAKPECRTNKRKLLANFIYDENKAFTTLTQWLKSYSMAQCTDVESVLRIHRLVVAEMDKSEGLNHDTKQMEQSKVKSDLKAI